jgi:hypothetical protein
VVAVQRRQEFPAGECERREGSHGGHGCGTQSVV